MKIIDEKWNKILTEFKEKPQKQVIYVLGPSDSGKTTFCKFLTSHLSDKFFTAYIDCDPGQSNIGPPTTVGLKFYSKDEKYNQANYLYFIGSTSPTGHLVQTLSGLKKLTEKTIYLGVRKVILDSSGFVMGKMAKEFQFQIIDLIQPDYIVCFQHSFELNDLLRNFIKNPKIKIHNLEVPSAAEIRNYIERREYREEKFRKYFQKAELQKLCWKGIGMHGFIPSFSNPDKFSNLLIALCDAENFVITLGIAESIIKDEKILQFYSPPYDQSKIASVQFGSIYLDLEGKQIVWKNQLT